MVGVTNAETFARDVLDKDGLVIVDYWAEWCSSCKALDGCLNTIAERYPDVDIYKIDIEEGKNDQLAARHSIKSLPTLQVFKNGELIYIKTGASPSVSGLINELVIPYL